MRGVTLLPQTKGENTLGGPGIVTSSRGPAQDPAEMWTDRAVWRSALLPLARRGSDWGARSGTPTSAARGRGGDLGVYGAAAPAWPRETARGRGVPRKGEGRAALGPVLLGLRPLSRPCEASLSGWGDATAAAPCRREGSAGALAGSERDRDCE